MTEPTTQNGVERIADERRKQLTHWSRAHDRECHSDHTLHDAALTLLGHDCGPAWARALADQHADDRVRRLTIAGALIAAELDRLYEID